MTFCLFRIDLENAAEIVWFLPLSCLVCMLMWDCEVSEILQNPN